MHAAWLPRTLLLFTSAVHAATPTTRSATTSCRAAMSSYYRKDGVKITHDPFAPGMKEKYGAPGGTDNEGFDPYADSVGAGIYSGTVQRAADGSVVIGKQYQGHNPRPGPVYSGGGYTPISEAISRFHPETLASPRRTPRSRSSFTRTPTWSTTSRPEAPPRCTRAACRGPTNTPPRSSLARAPTSQR
jgi:hypothetical protein